MKINEIREEDLDQLPADERWLALYTLQGLDKWPSDGILNRLIKKYGVEKPTTVYRGMNFDDKEDYDKFINDLKSNQGVLSFGSITSWTRNKGTAEQFAITRPTYYLSRELMMAHDEMSKNRERMIGYRGIILETVVGVKQGIDTSKSRHAKEDEIIVIPGKYKIRIHQEVKKFKDIMDDRDETLESILENVLKEKQEGKLSEYYRKFYDYVKHHYADNIRSNDKLKNIVYEVFKSGLREHKSLSDLIEIREPQQGYLERATKMYEVDISFAQGIFYLANQGFVPDDKIPEIEKYANKVVSAFEKSLSKYSGPEYFYSLGALKILEPWISDPGRIKKIYNTQIGKAYNLMNSRERIREINKITDPEERRLTIRKFTEVIEKILNQYTRNR